MFHVTNIFASAYKLCGLCRLSFVSLLIAITKFRTTMKINFRTLMLVHVLVNYSFSMCDWASSFQGESTCQGDKCLNVHIFLLQISALSLSFLANLSVIGT